jgi:hypothetical protein
MSEHTVYESAVRQVKALTAERDAQAMVVATLREQISALAAERDALRRDLAGAVETADRWRRAYIGDVQELAA